MFPENVKLTKPAAGFFEEASEDEQRELDRIFWLIGDDPYIDNKVKIVFNFPPIVGIMYVHPQFRLVYHHFKTDLISITAIWRPSPRTARFDGG